MLTTILIVILILILLGALPGVGYTNNAYGGGIGLVLIVLLILALLGKI